MDEFRNEQRRKRFARHQARLRQGGAERRSDLLLRQVMEEAEERAQAESESSATRLSRRLGPKGRFLAVAVVIGSLITAGHIYFERRTVSTASQADWQNEALVAKGASLYRANCAFCHGETLEGKPGWEGEYPRGGRPAMPLDASGPTWRLGDSDIFDVIKYGGQPFSPRDYKNDMPGFELQLQDADIWAVTAFVKSRWTDEFRRRQQEAEEKRRAGG